MRIVLLTLTLLSLAVVSVSVAVAKSAKLNTVFIMADNLGGRDLLVYGNRFNEAPHIDPLAKEGILFRNAYAAPVCSATRASIQSGLCPARVGGFDFIPGHWRRYEEVMDLPIEGEAELRTQFMKLTVNQTQPCES